MRKILAILLVTCSFLLGFFKDASAQQEFITRVAITYDIASGGSATVTHNVTLENAMSNLYAKSYTLYLEGIDPQNPRAYQGSRPLTASVSEEAGKTTVTVAFDDAVVGKGEKRNFSISFEDKALAVKTGEVWEISIPKVSDNSSFDAYEVRLAVPVDFGQVAYISPQPSERSISGGKYHYLFGRELISSNAIMAAFGQFQVFTFDLTYHLENPLARFAVIEVAIPPDSAFQKVTYEELSPRPEKVSMDPDGNFIALYRLKPRERVDVKAKGAVQIFSEPRAFPAPSVETLNANLLAKDFWETGDSDIAALAARLKTPRAIYDYVVSTLNYDYDRVRPNVARLGAKEALGSPKTAICMEFTDLFIAISRAAGIPAREVNGYAYTENPQLQPLSLVADVLHAWPEYWDGQRHAWIPVDPTWASTSGGLDYFSKLDLRHFAFVYHGQDSIKPYPPGSYKLGPNPQKDVFVSFGELPTIANKEPAIHIKTVRNFPILDMKLTVEVVNEGPVSLYNQTIDILFDDVVFDSKPVELLPPYGSYEVPVSVPLTFLGLTTPEKVEILFAGKSEVIPTFKISVTISHLLGIILMVFILSLTVYLKLKKTDIRKVFDAKKLSLPK